LPGNELTILMLAGNNPTSWIIYNHLVQEFGLFPILVENPVPRKIMLRNRAKKLGRMRVISQIAFVATIRRFLMWRDKGRIRALCAAHGLQDKAPVTSAILPIDSVNGDECRTFMAEIKPTVVVVNGTRIIGNQTLAAGQCSFINTHHGITPKYRGAHGAYWALLNDDRANCGVTVHLVDEGIDTGNIIAQEKIDPARDDSFVTYPYLLTAAALPILVDSIKSIRDGTLETRASEGTSALWYHPGFFQYLVGWWRRGVR
jgi:folate-dependent phosphoribosylglycinamide formyltransferase PurN